MHNTWAWTQRRTLSHSLMLGHMHLVAQVLSPVMSSMYMCVSPWVHFSHSLLRFVFHHFLPLLHFEQHTEFDNLIAMQAKVSNDANDVHTSLTSYEPNCMVEHSIRILLQSLDPHEMSLNIDMKIILLEKIFEIHWYTIDSVQVSVFWWTFEPHQSYQHTTQNLNKCGPSCAEDWWLVYHQAKTNTSM